MLQQRGLEVFGRESLAALCCQLLSLLQLSPLSSPALVCPSGAPDCTIVVDSAGMQHSKPLPGAESAKDVVGLARRGSSSSGTVLLNDAARQLDQIAALEAAAAAATPSKVPRPRTYYVDWLRGFLTVLVVLHHCVTAYQSSYAWAGKRGDTALWLLSQLFVGANQAYFMTLFFFLSGLYVPGSYKRKGPWQFLWDRLLRLVVPCIIYSFTAPPFILMWNELAKNPKANAGQALANAYRGWLKPGWPTTYVLPTGPVSPPESAMATAACCVCCGVHCSSSIVGSHPPAKLRCM